MVSIDNPFAAPASGDGPDSNVNFFQVAGDVLLCGREADLSAVCWVTGQPTDAQERSRSQRFRLIFWPGPLRQSVWLLPMLVLMSSRMLTGSWHLMAMLFLGTSWLWLPVVFRFRPTAYLIIAFSEQGRSLRAKHGISQVLRAILAASAALLALAYADVAGAILPADLDVIKYILMPLGGFAIVMWGWNLIFPPVLKSKSLVIRDYSDGVFSVHHAPREFLDGMCQLSEREGGIETDGGMPAAANDRAD